MLKVIAAIVPSAGLLFLFWLALRALSEADRRERAAEAKLTGRTRPAAGSGVGSVAGPAGSATSAAEAAPEGAAETPEPGQAVEVDGDGPSA